MAKGRIQLIREESKERTQEPQTTSEERGFFDKFIDLFRSTEEEEEEAIQDEQQGLVGRIERGNRLKTRGRSEDIDFSSEGFFEDKGFGASRQRDPSSGRPLLRAPLTIPETATTPEQTISVEDPKRTAVTFDPTKPQKLDREDVSRSGDRMSTTASQAIRNELGAGFDEHLDHRIALALSGSNVGENLELLPARENQKLGQKETKLMNQVVKGEISLVDAQLEMAKAKGVRLPESEPKLRQKIQNKALKLQPETLEKLASFQNLIEDPFEFFKTFSKAKQAKKTAERVAEEAREQGIDVNDPPDMPGLTRAVTQQIIKNAPKVPSKAVEATNILLDTFTPAIKRWFEDTGNILGEGLAYAVDPIVREEYQAGNLEVLPTITEKTPIAHMKLTLAAGIETAIYRYMPNLLKKSIYKRFGIGALEGLGFAISDGIAKDHSVEEIIDDAKIYMPFGGAIVAISPYITPLLKAELKNIPKGVRSVFKQVNKELKGSKPNLRQVRRSAGTRTANEIAEDKAFTRRVSERTLKQAEKPKTVRGQVSKVRPQSGATRILTQEVSGDITEENIKKSIQNLEKRAQQATSRSEKEEIFQRIRAVREQGEKVVGKKIKIEDDLNRIERVRNEPVDQISATKSVKETRRALRELSVDETAIESVVNKLSGMTNKENIKNVIRGLPRRITKPTKSVFPAGFINTKGVRSVLKREGYSSNQIKTIIDNVGKTTNGSEKLIRGRDIAREAEKFPIPEKKPTISESRVGGERFSTHFEKIKGELNGAGESVGLNTINLEDEARKAFNYINKNPKDAMKVSYGFQKPPSNINVQAVRISMIQALKSQGKLAQARAIAKKLSTQFSKSAQELNIAKLDLSSAGARRIEAIVLDERLSRIGKKLPKEFGDTAKDRALNKISKESKVAGDTITKQTSKVRKADEIIDQLIC